ncbi:PAS domain-containing protein [Massilia sp. ST3]|uniref:PAS domain-containing protein n=1 Tax=Massilia sp. ST3 TaxID=2824903 RepID=UPI001B82C06C|nr:PAS domain-containing protein [Massilia sp. ST3]MBQ5949269.1 PAS domain-containing protein [Massilia sp. ST3]
MNNSDQAHSLPDFELVFQGTPMPYLLLRPDLHIVAVNDAYLEATRTTRRHLLGLHLFDAFPDNPADPAATGVSNLRASLDWVLAHKAAHRMDIQKYDIPVRDSPHGEFVEKYWSPLNTPVLSAAGDVLYIIHQVEDVTEQTLKQQAAEAGEARFRQIADAMPQIVWSALPDGYHDYFNQQWYDFVGAPEGSTAGEAWSALFHPDDMKEAWVRWAHSLRTGEPYEVEYRLLHHSGQYRWVLGRALPVRSEAGDIVRWMGTCTDIHDWKVVQDKLEDMQYRLEAALSAAEIGTWTWNMREDRVYADRNLTRLFEVTEEEANGGPIGAYLGHIHPDDVESVRKDVADVLVSGDFYESFYRLVRADGSVRHIHARGKVYHDAEGRPTWLPGVALDITQQKLAEAARSRTESKFRAIAESNAIGIVQYGKDGSLIEPNEAFLAMLGQTGQDFSNGSANWDKLTAASSEFRQRWAELCSKGLIEPFETEFCRPDGSRLPVYIGAANFDRTGCEGIAYVLDVSAAKKAQLAVAESEAKFRTLAENIPQLAWMAAPDGTIFWFNNRWLAYTGKTLDEMRDWGWETVHHPDHVERVKAKYVDAIVTRQVVWEDTFPLRDAAGNYRWFLSRAVPIRRPDGEILHWLGTNTDVTVQREAEAALEQANRRKDDFLAMLAHELRNPLAPISTAAQLLKLPGQGEAVVKRASEMIGRQVKHLTELVDDLLDVSRVTRGLVSIDKREVDVKQVISNAVEQSSPVIESRQHTLSMRLASAHPFVLGDNTRLVQVLTNLLNNAAKYTPQGGEIRLAMEIHDAQVSLSVSDNGIGMDAALLPTVFDLFTQAERTPDRSQGGLGLGLALVKSIVQLHGGEVMAQSEGPGKGSCFTVLLPLLEKRRAADLAADHGAAGEASPLRILLVDDNQDAAQSLAAVLQSYGHAVTVSADAHEALEQAHAAPPDVFLLDIGLPDMDGYELSRRLHACPESRNATYVAVTGYGQAHDKVLAKAAGFDHYFVKPVDLPALQDVLAANGRGRHVEHH